MTAARCPSRCWHKPSRNCEARFGAAFWETQVVQGAWEHEGATFRDNLTRFFVDVPDLPEHRAFFKEFKQTLKLRFQQVEVWITSHEVDVI